MALGVTHKWPKAFPVIGFFGAESETQQARRCALSIDREPEQTHHWTVIQSGAVACGFRRRIPILRSAYVPREALGITASGSFAPREALHAFPALDDGFEKRDLYLPRSGALML